MMAQIHKTPEDERLSDLHSYSILDSLPEEDYDNITALAAHICGTPISLVSLVDHRRQWFKSHHGLNATETPKEVAFCAHAVQQPDDVFIINDAREDSRFQNNPLVTGDPHVIFYAGVPLVSENNFPLGTLCVIDHHPRVLSEAQIYSLKALSRQVINLLRLRKQKHQLELALRSLEQKNIALEKFASIAAHDIKSPLTNISTLVDIFSKTYGNSVGPDGHKVIELIKHSSATLKNLVNGLLEYSRSERVLQEKKSVIDLRKFLKEIEELFIAEHQPGIRITSSLTNIVANKTGLEQVFINLVANAIKYNDKEVADIEIGVSEKYAFYEFYVKDNGPGIRAEDQEKIFSIFEVLVSKDKFGQTGSGIGLATVKKLIEALGGNIRVVSEPGQGATFIFTIQK